jgi:hypothetical protein
LIPSALATNLRLLRVCSIAREARRRGTRPGQRTTLSVGLLLLRAPPYMRRGAMAIAPGSAAAPGDPSGYRPAAMPITTPTWVSARMR